MFQKKLTHSEARKQLLIVESDLNRSLLTRDYRDLVRDVNETTAPIRHSIAVAYATIHGLKEGFSHRAPTARSHKSSWWSTLLDLAVGLASGMRRDN